VLYLLVNPAGDKKNNTIGADQVLGSLITTLDTVIVYAVYISEVEATLEAVGEELDPNC
jgi:prephenate dehydrogenase